MPSIALGGLILSNVSLAQVETLSDVYKVPKRVSLFCLFIYSRHVVKKCVHLDRHPFNVFNNSFLFLSLLLYYFFKKLFTLFFRLAHSRSPEQPLPPPVLFPIQIFPPSLHWTIANAFANTYTQGRTHSHTRQHSQPLRSHSYCVMGVYKVYFLTP